MTSFHSILRTYKNMIVSITILLFCGIAIVGAVIPAVRKTLDMMSQLKTMNSEIQTLQHKLEALNALSEDILRSQLDTVLSAVPPDRSFASLFDTVEGVANRTGVTLVDMSISQGTTLATPSAAKVSVADKQLGTRTIPFRVTVTGSLRALEQFITVAPGVRRLLRIRTFSLTFPKSDRPVSVSIEMDGFYEPLPTSLGVAKATLPTLSQEETNVITTLSEMPLIGEVSETLPPPRIGKVKENPFSP